jgi:hypothetical protein
MEFWPAAYEATLRAWQAGTIPLSSNALGYSSLEMTRKYVTLTTEDLQQVPQISIPGRPLEFR